MEAISSKIRTNKKDHKCDACWRICITGVKMNNVTVSDQGSLYTWRECPTCMELLKKYPEKFTDGLGVFEAGCVYNYRKLFETPEMLLERFTLGGS